MMKQLLCSAPAALVVLVCSHFTLTVSAANEARRGGDTDPPAPMEIRERVDRRETTGELLGTRSTDIAGRASDRMEESSRRLAKQLDAGKETQVIQQKIMEDLEKLAEAVKKERNSPPPKGGDVGPAGEPKDGAPAGQQKVGEKPGPGSAGAEKSVATAGEKPAARPADFEERREVFMRVSPRVRGAVMEGATEKAPSKYEKMTEDYYRGVAQAGR